ncbi:hypothetical protein JCM8202_002255 [Rhodotorula sphaerocarpa]
MTEKAVRQLRTNFERLGARLGENLAEHSRDLGLVDAFASGSGGGSGKYLESGAAITPAGIEETKRMLASKRDFERTEGLKRVIAMMTKNLPVTSFFPLVTSLLSPSTPLQSRSLISLYIVHCASHAPELALLSINAYQKDLSDPNPLVRAGAITTLSSMQLPDIRELVGMAIQKGVRDSSWYVRRATADAVRALYRADPTADNLAVLRPTLQVSLDGASPLTLGAALTAWEELCPTEWDLIHPNYRRICKMLMDVDEWGQATALRILARYGRSFFLDPEATGKTDPDAELALKNSEALLQHLNPAVVLGVVKLHHYIGGPARQQKVVKPLLRLLHGEPEIVTLALEACVLLAEQKPELFKDHLSTFFVRFSEPVEGRRARVRILIALANESNIRLILQELLTYVEDVDDSFAATAIEAIGTCAERVPQVAPDCLQTLTKLLGSSHDPTVASAVLVLQTLVRSPSFPSTASRSSVIARLASYLYTSKVTDPIARSTIYWLVGQFAQDGLLEGCGPDVVRLGAKQFAEESLPAKLQLLTLSAKLLVLSDLSPQQTHLRPLALIFDYLTLLARYDLAYEVRDRARLLAGLIGSSGIGKGRTNGAEGGDGARMMLEEDDFRKGVLVEDLAGENGAAQEREAEEKPSLTAEQVRAVLFDGKSFEVAFARSSEPDAQIGTFGLALPGKRPFPTDGISLSSLPPYSTTVPPSSIRDPPAGSASAAASPSAGGSRASSGTATPLQAFGSDSFTAGGHSAASSPGGGGGSSRRRNGPVVLVPGSGGEGPRSFGGASGPAGASASRREKKQSLNDFLAASEEEEEETSSEEEEEEEEEETSSERSEEEEEDGEEGEEGSSEDSSEGGEADSGTEEAESSGQEDVGGAHAAADGSSSGHPA